jgi:hypothetical protein
MRQVNIFHFLVLSEGREGAATDLLLWSGNSAAHPVLADKIDREDEEMNEKIYSLEYGK